MSIKFFEMPPHKVEKIPPKIEGGVLRNQFSNEWKPKGPIFMIFILFKRGANF
jgi:hypothetical protein